MYNTVISAFFVGKLQHGKNHSIQNQASEDVRQLIYRLCQECVIHGGTRLPLYQLWHCLDANKSRFLLPENKRKQFGLKAQAVQERLSDIINIHIGVHW